MGGLGDEGEEVVFLDVDNLLWLGFYEFLHIFVLRGLRFYEIFICKSIGWEGELGADLAVHLDDDFDGFLHDEGLVPSGPSIVRM